MKTKICTKCEEEKDLKEFSLRYGKPQPWCKQCTCIRSAQYYNDNKKKHKKNIIARAARQQAIYVDWKRTLSCQCCGEDYGPCLNFHHVDPSLKKFAISNAIGKQGLNKIINEIEKCVVVCSNCHAKIHNGVVECPKINQAQNVDLLTEMLDIKSII